MSFLKGKNVENINRDTFAVLRSKKAKAEAWLKLEEDAHESRDDVRALYESGLLSREEAEQEMLELYRQRKNATKSENRLLRKGTPRNEG